jgi:hypothetical protein
MNCTILDVSQPYGPLWPDTGIALLVFTSPRWFISNIGYRKRKHELWSVQDQEEKIKCLRGRKLLLGSDWVYSAGIQTKSNR